MTEAQIEESGELLEELQELRKIDELLNNDQGKLVNVRFHQHYGETKHYQQVEIKKRHTMRFVAVVREIITEIETEIDKL